MRHKDIFLLLFFVFLFQFQIGYAQICGGNLGTNIFTNGNFGAGEPNFLPVNPNIAPGYRYVTNNPVNDGEYTITNGTQNWSEISSWEWLSTGDNSANPEGYMMLVNADYDPGLFYEEQITGLCENSLFEFKASILNLARAGTNKIKPNVSFLIDGVEVYTTGLIPANERWNVYGFTFTTDPGQTSVTLALRNNAPGGIGNDLAIDNISFRACGPRAEILPFQTAFVCEDSGGIVLDATISGNQYTDPHYQWQFSPDGGTFWLNLDGDTFPTFEHNINIGGYYPYRYLLANSKQNLLNPKCRIVSNTKIIRVTPKFTNIRDTVCEGLERVFGFDTLKVSGSFTDSLKTPAGCDSIVTLDLYVIPDRGIEAKFTIFPPSCTGFSDAEIRIDSIFDGTPNFRIEFDSLRLNNLRVNNLSSGQYNFHISDRFGCEMDTVIEIIDPDEFLIDLSSVAEVELGDSLDVFSSSNYPINSYSWLPLNYSDCNTSCDQIKILPRRDFWFYLNALSEANCEAQDSIFIKVIDKKDIDIPNVFTPNGDGKNDFFQIVAEFPNVLEIKDFSVYNRWGQEVYFDKSIAFSNNWSGWNGDNLPAGVYYYSMTIRFLDDELLDYKGYVHLLK